MKRKCEMNVLRITISRDNRGINPDTLQKLIKAVYDDAVLSYQFIKPLYTKEDAAKQVQAAMEFAINPFNPKEEKPQHTFYCLFYPLGIYCDFGAENIHHAYNKAAKYWGAPKQVGNPYDDIPHSVINRQCRILVTPNLTDMSPHHKLISHTLMTKLVKAWREENS